MVAALVSVLASGRSPHTLTASDWSQRGWDIEDLKLLQEFNEAREAFTNAKAFAAQTGNTCCVCTARSPSPRAESRERIHADQPGRAESLRLIQSLSGACQEAETRLSELLQ